MRIVSALLSVVVLGGCASVLRSTATCPCAVAPASWQAALQTAEQLSHAGNFAAADSVLVAYVESNPESHFSREIVFWRALYRLDPRNPAQQPLEAGQLLDSYLQSDSVWWYKSEARVLRQLASMVPLAPTAAIEVPPPAGPPPAAPLPVTRAADATITDKDLEIQQLRERVARLNEELERIKRRLSTP